MEREIVRTHSASVSNLRTNSEAKVAIELSGEQSTAQSTENVTIHIVKSIFLTSETGLTLVLDTSKYGMKEMNGYQMPIRCKTILLA